MATEADERPTRDLLAMQAMLQWRSLIMLPARLPAMLARTAANHDNDSIMICLHSIDQLRFGMI